MVLRVMDTLRALDTLLRVMDTLLRVMDTVENQGRSPVRLGVFAARRRWLCRTRRVLGRWRSRSARRGLAVLRSVLRPNVVLRGPVRSAIPAVLRRRRPTAQEIFVLRRHRCNDYIRCDVLLRFWVRKRRVEVAFRVRNQLAVPSIPQQTALCGTALCGTALCGTALCGTAHSPVA